MTWLTLLSCIALTQGAASQPEAATQQVRRRAVTPLSDRSQATLTFGRSIGAKGRPIETPQALAAFFAHLDALAGKSAQSSLRIVTFGNSLISADNVTNIVRERLSERFGDGGRGLVLVDRFANYGPRNRSGYAPAGHWNAFNLAIGDKGRGVFGIGGVVHEAAAPGAYTEWRLKGETKGELFWLDRKDGEIIDLRVDNKNLVRITPEHQDDAQRTQLTLPEGSKRLQLVAPKGRVSLFGVSLERATPGIVFDTIGIPAAEASSYLLVKESTALDQIAARHPTLLIFMLGGNEIRRLSWVRGQKAEQRKLALEADLANLVGRMKRGAPEASCLIVGPIDAVYNNQDSPQKLKTRPQTDEINAMERKVAADKGCAFFDMFAAMGGKGSLAKFFDHDMLQEDLVHPKGRGFDLLGELFAKALLEAYVETPASPEELATRTPQ
jgi:lysophospholipase L1-like esterase